MSGELSRLQAPEGANRARKHKGRGLASGNGKTAGRGHKGQKARKSGNVRVGFEGGQMPIARRMPKRGFKSNFGWEFAEIRLSDLNRFPAGSLVDHAALKQAGLARGARWDGIKVIGDGPLQHRVDVKTNRISDGARKLIEDAGGKVELIPDRPKWVRADTREARRAAKQRKA